MSHLAFKKSRLVAAISSSIRNDLLPNDLAFTSQIFVCGSPVWGQRNRFIFKGTAGFSYLHLNITGVLMCVCPSYRMGSRSPPNTSQPIAFFSKLTESTSDIVKSKKQEMSKKMTLVGNDSDFSKSDLSTSKRARPKVVVRRKHVIFDKEDVFLNNPCSRSQTLVSLEQRSSICRRLRLQVIYLIASSVQTYMTTVLNAVEVCLDNDHLERWSSLIYIWAYWCPQADFGLIQSSCISRSLLCVSDRIILGPKVAFTQEMNLTCFASWHRRCNCWGMSEIRCDIK